MSADTGRRRVVRSPSFREQALDEIRSAIITGELAEHTVYSAAALAKQLGMSLSPVREAMMSLVAEGTVEAVPNRGYRLVPVTEADLEEIILIRSLLTVPAVRRLCEAGEPESIERLRELAGSVLEAARSEDSAAFLTADRRFYGEVLRAGLGHRAASIGLRLRDQSRVADLGPKSPAVDLRSAQETIELVEAIAAGRADEAERLVVDNLHYFRKTEAG
ncbi:GntR family transcriptional regulator [Brevibacterium sp. CS2]|uniref:GntR family transcriptional regulator n=1 Tax=Brevibacterium sp. CS2 TaxID=2575923 RepID=UPI0010C7DDD9|nr:GntR family transcriptional regulator [Brevibacterium sp. CS2]QCP04589.1 GntR family transcriptional regulator [Brevibacterium sp. CS2]